MIVEMGLILNVVVMLEADVILGAMVMLKAAATERGITRFLRSQEQRGAAHLYQR